MAKIDETKYSAMVANAAAQVKISSTIFKNFIADVKAVVDGNDDAVNTHVTSKAPHTVSACRVYSDVVQPIANSTEIALAFNGELFDSDVMHDNTTDNSRITIKTAGKYKFTAQIELAASAVGTRTLAIKVNGVNYHSIVRIDPPSAGQCPMSLTTNEIDMSVNDYAQVFVTQTSGGSLDVSASSASLRFKCGLSAVLVSK